MAVEKKNIFLTQTAQVLSYSSKPGRNSKKYPERLDIVKHAKKVKDKIADCYHQQVVTQAQAAAISYKEGIYLEFSGEPGCELNIKSLENRRNGIYILNVHQDEKEGVVRATVYIPDKGKDYFSRKAEDYAHSKTAKGKPKNNDLISSIEDVRLAVIKSFWYGRFEDLPQETSRWCEVWLRCGLKQDKQDYLEKVEESFNSICRKNNIVYDDRKLIFPERIVKLVKVTNEDLFKIMQESPFLAEIRLAPECTSFFDNLSCYEQNEWCEDLLKRIVYDNNKNKISICLLDTGVNYGHKLLNFAVNSANVQSVENAWSPMDSFGHGTEMAGIALYYDLKAALISKEKVILNHEIESVKIISPNRENPPSLYGAITEQAVARAELANPQARRVFCMAVTAKNAYDNGSPSSWSAAIDNITSGANEEGERRLFIISAGNVELNEMKTIGYPNANIIHSVENPGQSWNAITVGAYSGDVFISEEAYKDYQPIADMNGLSPYSSTSTMWGKKWPIKPEVLFDGGNVAYKGNDYVSCTDLSLLTTYGMPLIKDFSTIWATSSAAAQAANFCAKIMNEYPDIWAETVRALMIHSASWSENMVNKFCKPNNKSTGRHTLLRTCGYGIPDINKALECFNNNVNMVIQGTLQPYNGEAMNEMHMHRLPWPKDVLRDLGNTLVKVKVTLSYFIEPGPGEIGWQNRYRYASCGLRFDLNNSNEGLTDFEKRINASMRGEDKNDRGEGTSGSGRWFLGTDNRDVGSIHSDFCELSAVDLCDCNYVAVYPVVGWWRERKYLGKSNNPVRYALVVSLSTEDKKVDLYTPIINQITTSVTRK